jgi:hypothetical protein
VTDPVVLAPTRPWTELLYATNVFVASTLHPEKYVSAGVVRRGWLCTLSVSRKSIAFKSKTEAVERAEANLLQELEVRLVLVRTGVLPDPEAVRRWSVGVLHAAAAWPARRAPPVGTFPVTNDLTLAGA